MVVVTHLPPCGESHLWAIREVLSALANVWARGLTQKPLPPLYRSGVHYAPEPWAGSGREEWADPWTVCARGWGDCDDLVGWRVAELRAAGEHATIQVMRRNERYHVRVRRADGTLEDPSIALMPASQRRRLRR